MFVNNGFYLVLHIVASNDVVYRVIQFWINLYKTVNWYLQVKEV